VAVGSKVVLTTADNRRLSEWQRQNLSVTVATAPSPWLIESMVIAVMQPPLNLAANSASSYHAHLTQARAAFRASVS